MFLHSQEFQKKHNTRGTSYVMVNHVQRKRIEFSHLLYEIGNLVSKLTKYEVENIYQSSFYVFKG